jgi:hypothetical protein
MMCIESLGAVYPQVFKKVGASYVFIGDHDSKDHHHPINLFILRHFKLHYITMQCLTLRNTGVSNVTFHFRLVIRVTPMSFPTLLGITEANECGELEELFA